MNAPEVSVVMAVYNGAKTLEASLDSVLDQQGVELECIVVDDGSTDATPEILARAARRDPRLRVQRLAENQGLTRALIQGCAMARGRFIARQDCGDISLPGRLRAQLNLALERPDAAMISCGTRFLGPGGEELYTIVQDSGQATAGLQRLDARRIRGPSHHGSVFFPRTMYKRAGGYRDAFRVAQDLDLWLRLVEHGPHLSVPRVLYQAQLTPGAISSTLRNEQQQMTRLIIAAARLRRAGNREGRLLQRAREFSVSMSKRDNTARPWAFPYFIGAVLLRRDPQAAQNYFFQALKHSPCNIRIWVRIIQISSILLWRSFLSKNLETGNDRTP